MSLQLCYITQVLRDTEILENHVGRTFEETTVCQFRDHLNQCDIPRDVQKEYSNLIFSLQTGLSVEWQPDILTIRNFREEIIKYRDSLIGQKKQNNSPNRSSHIRLMEE